MHENEFPSREMYQIPVMGGAVEVRTWDCSNTFSAEVTSPFDAIKYVLHPQPLACEVSLGHPADSTFVCNTGELMFVPAGLPLSFRITGGHITTVSCHFDPTYFEQLTGLHNAWERQSLTSCFEINSSQLRSYMMTLAREIMTNGRGDGALADSLSATAAVAFARYFQQASLQARKLHSGGLSPWQWKKIRNMVANRGGRPISANIVADECGISIRHLSRVFKQTVGMTLHEYLNCVRLSKAMVLLANSTLPIKVITSDLGYPDQSGFSIAFKKAVGQSPKEFRDNVRVLQCERTQSWCRAVEYTSLGGPQGCQPL